jgi:hypothetical protein
MRTVWELASVFGLAALALEPVLEPVLELALEPVLELALELAHQW